MNSQSKKRIERIIECYQSLIMLDDSENRSRYEKSLSWWEKELQNHTSS